MVEELIRNGENKRASSLYIKPTVPRGLASLSRGQYVKSGKTSHNAQ